MTKGGARNRSGPPKDPSSLKSAAIGFTLTALPSEGYVGEAPELSDYLPSATARELDIWSKLWTTPQACAWSLESWRWPIIADLAKYLARADDPDAPIGIATAVRQLRDDNGLSKAGLIANGWAIAADETAPKRAAKKAVQQTSARDRMKVVQGGGSA
ncbi:hypothetical protein [Jatrophihabitans sp.]|uniref:hypothetical protein n=1 Tax=Jatrophihabitans sp. TaxID=1932789 RepID=UPI0030C76D78|nr:hypothetical protein [Jatrophihabitans sp.]